MYDVSVIIPLYNVEKYIKTTLDSVLNQCFEGSYQVILIDDGSIDDTGKICEKYVNNKVLYKKIENNGVGNARNIGISLAQGKFITFMDSDDTVPDNYLQILYDAFEEDCDLVVAGYKRINEINQKEVVKRIQSSVYEKKNFYELLPNLQKNNLLNQVWNKMFKLEIIKKYNLTYPTEINYGEDFRFVLKYLNYTQKIKIIDNVVYNYVNRTNGLNLKYSSDRIYINLQNVFLLENFLDTNSTNTLLYSKYIKDKLFNTLLSGICSIYDNPCKKNIKVELRKFLSAKDIILKLKSYKSVRINLILLFARYGSIFFSKFIKIMNLLKKQYKKIKLGY